MKNKHTGILATETASVAFAAFLSLLRHTGTELPSNDSTIARMIREGLEEMTVEDFLECPDCGGGDDECPHCEGAGEVPNPDYHTVEALAADFGVIEEALRFAEEG